MTISFTNVLEPPENQVYAATLHLSRCYRKAKSHEIENTDESLCN